MSDYGYVATSRRLPTFSKDPSDTIDYSLVWVELGEDTISTSTWQSDDLSVGTSSIDGHVVTVFVSGGTAGVVTNLTNRITTAGGRTLERSVYVAVEEM